MASKLLRPGSAYWYLKVKRKGKWVQEATTIRRDAPNAARRLKRALAVERMQETSAPHSQHGWLWVPAFLERAYRDKTLLRYQAAWTAIEVWMDEMEILGPSDVTFQNAKEYPDWRVNVDPKIMRQCVWNSALTELRVLSSVMQEAVARGYIPANPCFRLGLKRRDTKKKPEITDAEQKKIEAALVNEPPWMLHCWTVAMHQGFRLSETAVPVANIDLEPRPGLPNGSLWVKGKGGKIHVAPLHAAVRAIAEKATEEKRALLVDFPKSPAKEWWKFFRRLKMKISFHSTRVTVVTRLARHGHSKAQTMAYVGHASETVHDVYTRLGAADVAHLGDSLLAGQTSGKSQDAPSASPEPKSSSPDNQA